MIKRNLNLLKLFILCLGFVLIGCTPSPKEPIIEITNVFEYVYSIKFDIKIDNNKTTLTKLEVFLLKNDLIIESTQPISDSEIKKQVITCEFNSLDPNTNYRIEVVVDYSNLDQTYSDYLASSYEVVTKSFDSVVNLSLTNIMKSTNSISFDYKLNGSEIDLKALTIILKEGNQTLKSDKINTNQLNTQYSLNYNDLEIAKDYNLEFVINIDYLGASYNDIIIKKYYFETGIQVAPNDYMIINSVEDLININNDLEGKYILYRDLDLTDVKWIGIGTYDQPFRGVIDGNGFEIKNLSITEINDFYTINIDDSVIGMSSFGLIAFGENIEISNLGMTDLNVEITNFEFDFDGGDQSLEDLLFNGGSLVAHLRGGIISNCYSSGSISLESDNIYIDSFIGGLVGWITKDSVIEDCNNYINLSFDNWTGSFGGIVGGLSFFEPATLTIKNTNNYGNVITLTNGNLGYLGGITGNAYGNLDAFNCHNFGDILALGKFGAYAGGIMGTSKINGKGIEDHLPELFISIRYCSNSGNIESNTISNDEGFAGGIAGYIGFYSLIEGCYNLGKVTSIETAGGIVGALKAQGIVGGSQFIHLIVDSYNAGAIKGLSILRGYVGGIAGEAYSTVLSNCLSVGEVIGEFNHNMIVGHILQEQFMMINCYYYGNHTSYLGNANKVSLDQLNSKSFYLDLLNWDQSVWSFDLLDFLNQKLPVIDIKTT